jgi:hypothetical protein
MYKYFFLLFLSILLISSKSGEAAKIKYFKCSINQIEIIENAILDANEITNYALTYLTTLRCEFLYNRWFGEIDNRERLLINQIYQKIISFLDGNENIDIDCIQYNEESFCEKDSIAYRDAHQTTNIYLCNEFYNISDTPEFGYLTKAGILIHELSHIFGYTEDYLYGYKRAKNLAKRDRILAQTNADNYAYLCEDLRFYHKYMGFIFNLFC